MNDNSIKILSQQEIKTEYIRTSKKSKNINQKIFIYDINYRPKIHDQFLLLQTPKLYLPFGISKSYDNDEKNQLHLSFQDADNKMKDFINLITQIDQHFQETYPFYQMMSSIKQNEDKFYPPYLKVKIPNINQGFQVYDVFNNPQKLEYLVPGTWLTSIIYLKHLWVNDQENIMGLGWYILQTKAKIPMPILNHCIIDDDWEQETLCAICYSKIVKQPIIPNQSEQPHQPIPEGYETYVHMLKLGIPLLAVIQKCQMDGMDPEVLHQHKRGYKSNNQINNQTNNNLNQIDEGSNNIPRPPPLPKNEIKRNGDGKVKITEEELLAGRERLGKNKNNRTLQKKKEKKADPRVPSLDMILSSIKKLKKLNNS